MVVFGPGHERAASWQARTDLIAPDLICAEVGNALWRYTERRALKPDEAAAIIAQLPENFLRLVPSMELAADALRLAGKFDHPIYDCFYLALAERDGGAIVTLDREMARMAEQMGLPAELLL